MTKKTKLKTKRICRLVQNKISDKIITNNQILNTIKTIKNTKEIKLRETITNKNIKIRKEINHGRKTTIKIKTKLCTMINLLGQNLKRGSITTTKIKDLTVKNFLRNKK